MTTQREYVLGTGSDELARLALQHRLWSDAAHSLWRRAGIQPGMRVLDVGSGPGFAALDLAQFVTSAGFVAAVDESQSFIEHVTAQATSRSLPHLAAAVGDVHELPDVFARHAALAGRGGRAEDSFDIAYARWVLCFVKDPARVVRGVARLLKPGGRFCVHDYFMYRSMTTAPARPAFTKAVLATAQSWEDRGGDTNIMGRLPRLAREAGLRLDHLDVHVRLARGTDAMFTWPDVWWRIYAPKLVDMGLLTRADCDQLIRDLDELRASPTDFVVCPPVFEMILTKA